MSSIFGVHLINGAGPHLDDLKRLQPATALFLDPNPDDVAQFRAACPGTICIGRIYIPDSEVEQRICANPEEAALWAHGLVLGQPARSWINFWQVPNEVCQFADKLPLINRFFVRWMQLADTSGYKCAVFGWSVGQIDMPANERLALWKLVYPTCAYAEEHGHIGLVHGYGAPDLWGPPEKGGAPWLINRLETQVLPLLPYKKLKFVYGEYGIDGLLLLDLGRALAEIEDPGVGVRTPPKPLESYAVMVEPETRGITGPTGWQGFTDAAGYIEQLTDMGKWLTQFSNRILGYCIFTLGNNAPWGSYDIQGDVLRGLADYYRNAPPIEPPITPPTLAQMLQAKFGSQFSDKRGKLPVHATLKYAKRALGVIARAIIHHSVTAQTTTPDVIARYHVDNNGWPGIGYHYAVYADGRVMLLNDPETISYHAGSANGNSIGICVIGDYRTDVVTPALWQRILDVKTVNDAYVGRTLSMIGHRDAPGNATVCPGANLYAKLTIPTPEVPVAIKLGSYVNDFNLKIVPFEQRPDKASWQDGPYYRILQVFTTRDGSWEPSTNPGSIDQWAVDAWHSGADWKGAGGTNNFFIKVLDRAGNPLAGKGLYYWQGPMTVDPSKLTNVNRKDTWQTGDENLPVWDYYDPGKGEMGKWGGSVIGRSDALMGVDLPYKWHTSTFVVLQESDADPVTPPTGNLDLDTRNLAYNNCGKLSGGVPYNPTLAFPKEAARLNLGAPQTLELRQLAGYVIQGFALGILRCKDGDWGNITKLTW